MWGAFDASFIHTIINSASRGGGGEIFCVAIYNGNPNSALTFKGIICIRITLTKDFQAINSLYRLIPTWPISFSSVDNSTCKLPRMFPSECSDPCLNPENKSGWVQEPEWQQCAGWWAARGGASKEVKTSHIENNRGMNWAACCMVPLHNVFAFSKELQWIWGKADKARTLGCSSQGESHRFSKKEKSQWVNDGMGILPFLEDDIWP